MSVIVNGCNDGQKCTWDQGGQLKLPKRQKRLGMSYLIDSIYLNMAKRQTINVIMREKLRNNFGNNNTIPAKKHDIWQEGSCFLARCHVFCRYSRCQFHCHVMTNTE